MLGKASSDLFVVLMLMVVLSDMRAPQLFDPTVDSRPPTTIQEYDDIIERFIRLVFIVQPSVYIVVLTIFRLSAKPCTNLREELKIGYLDLRVSLLLC